MPGTPREFFETHVLPNYMAWMACRSDVRLAMNAVAEVNNMAEHHYRYWKDRDQSQIYDASNPGDYRELLAKHECRDFELVRDVAEAHKHVELSRSTRQVTRSDQTKERPVVWGGPAYWGGDAYFGGSQLVVTLDDGTKRPLSKMMENVMEMWERLLERV